MSSLLPLFLKICDQRLYVQYTDTESVFLHTCAIMGVAFFYTCIYMYIIWNVYAMFTSVPTGNDQETTKSDGNRTGISSEPIAKNFNLRKRQYDAVSCNDSSNDDDSNLPKRKVDQAIQNQAMYVPPVFYGGIQDQIKI